MAEVVGMGMLKNRLLLRLTGSERQCSKSSSESSRRWSRCPRFFGGAAVTVVIVGKDLARAVADDVARVGAAAGAWTR